jgi:Lon protease-like protein
MNLEPIELEISVFPLPKVTLFPSTSQPLNIFEPRYIQMIKESIALDRPIALTSTASVGRVAGCGRAQLLQEREDGTMMILVRADLKVRLTSLDELSKPYLLAKAVTLVENVQLDPGNIFYLHRLMKEMSGWLERNVPQPKRRNEFIEKMGTDEERVNTACSLLIEDADWQQKLLEFDNLNERIKTAAALLETSAASH